MWLHSVLITTSIYIYRWQPSEECIKRQTWSLRVTNYSKAPTTSFPQGVILLLYMCMPQPWCHVLVVIFSLFSVPRIVQTHCHTSQQAMMKSRSSWRKKCKGQIQFQLYCLTPGNHFTNKLWAHNLNLAQICAVVTWTIMIRWGHNFAHVTTT